MENCENCKYYGVLLFNEVALTSKLEDDCHCLESPYCGKKPYTKAHCGEWKPKEAEK